MNYRLTLPRFSPNVEEELRNAVQERIESRRRHRIIVAGYVFFLIGGALILYGTMGAGLPVLILSGVFFGIGIVSTVTGFLRRQHTVV